MPPPLHYRQPRLRGTHQQRSERECAAYLSDKVKGHESRLARMRLDNCNAVQHDPLTLDRGSFSDTWRPIIISSASTETIAGVSLDFERRSRAVLVADVVGYTRLMESAELDTHKRYRAIRV